MVMRLTFKTAHTSIKAINKIEGFIQFGSQLLPYFICLCSGSECNHRATWSTNGNLVCLHIYSRTILLERFKHFLRIGSNNGTTHREMQFISLHLTVAHPTGTGDTPVCQQIRYFLL